MNVCLDVRELCIENSFESKKCSFYVTIYKIEISLVRANETEIGNGWENVNQNKVKLNNKRYNQNKIKTITKKIVHTFFTKQKSNEIKISV